MCEQGFMDVCSNYLGLGWVVGWGTCVQLSGGRGLGIGDGVI